MTIIFKCLPIFHEVRFVCRQRSVSIAYRFLNSKIPKEPFIFSVDKTKLPPRTKIDDKTIAHLERLSLVDFGNEKGIEILESAIEVADLLSVVDTHGVEPMVTVLENQNLQLRADVVTDGNCRDDVMHNATETEEEYFVAPPGNIPLESTVLSRKDSESDKKQVQRKTMTSVFHKILELSELHGYIKPIIINNVINHFKYGPLGELLAQNIRNEWVYSNVTNREENVFLYHDSRSDGKSFIHCKDAFKNAREISQGYLPFGLATTRDDQIEVPVPNVGLQYFHPTCSHCLRYMAFTSPSQGQQFFYRWQQQRKMWWRKFSADPGRFSFSQVSSVADKKELETTNISANFPWGNETLETIINHGTVPFDSLEMSEKTFFEARDGQKKILPYVIESICTEATAVMAFLCDAYSEPSVMGASRKLLRLHRKLAPYKTTFVAASTSSSVRDELRLLATFLNQGLRKAGISTLLPGLGLAKKSLESQLALNDCLGIPFTIVLSQTTLDNGVVGIRSRETTLEEQTHVSKLVNYVEMLMKNY